MSKRRRSGIGIAMAAALGLGGAWSGLATAAPGTRGGPAFTPAQLVGTLHRVNQMEAQAGKMAQRRGSTDAMRRYGATLERDHATADGRLKAYASRHDLALDTAPPIGISSQLDQARHELDNLQNLGGVSFDRQFAELMVQDHQKAVQIVGRARTEVTDPQLQAMLAEVEPTLREHEQIARKLLVEDDATAPSTTSTRHGTSR